MTARPRIDWLSPSLTALPDGIVPAYEVKYLLTAAQAADVEAWAATRLSLDPHADPARGNRYLVTSVYFDTPDLGVLRRADGLGRHKYRVRRYGDEPTAHLERKSKQDGRVWKHRTPSPIDRLDALADPAAGWFAQELADYGLVPVCRVSYERTAFIGAGPNGPVRLTLDRSAAGARADGPTPVPVADGPPLLADEVIAEFKFLGVLPAVFKEVIEACRLAPSPVSKYRRCAAAVGLAAEGAGDA